VDSGGLDEDSGCGWCCAGLGREGRLACEWGSAQPALMKWDCDAEAAEGRVRGVAFPAGGASGSVQGVKELVGRDGGQWRLVRGAA